VGDGSLDGVTVRVVTQRAAADSIGDLFSGALKAVDTQSGTKSVTKSATTPPLTCEDMVPPREFES
jgi:hypothetical protein